MARTTDNSHFRCSSEPAAFDARTRRVLELRARIREGAYAPNPRDVAGAMLEEWIAVRDAATSAKTAPGIDSEATRRTAIARFVVPRVTPQSAGTDGRTILSA